jgi:hypothetical protein
MCLQELNCKRTQLYSTPLICGTSMCRNQSVLDSEDVWSCVFVHCSSSKLCQLSQTCKMFRTIAPDAATAKLCPNGFFSKELCSYLDDFGGKTGNDSLHDAITETIVTKLHETALTRLNMLTVSIFFAVIRNEVQIHGVRLLNDFYKRGVLQRHKTQVTSSIKLLFYYETSLSKVMDLVMLQGVLCHVFQMSIDNITQFSPSQNVSHLREPKIDGTNITQVLCNMMTWTETRSLMDKLEEDEWAIAWPTHSVTHTMLKGMLGTKKFHDINVFMTNILTYIQVPFATLEKPASREASSERYFMVENKRCYSNFQFSVGPKDEINEDSYLCVMDITEGHVICHAVRMTMRIVFNDDGKSTRNRRHGWMFP